MDYKRCTVCGLKIYPGHGSMLVKNNLNLMRFCSSKCRKLFTLKKNPLFLRWTRNSRKIKGKILKFPKERQKTLEREIILKKNYSSYLILRTLFLYKKFLKIKESRALDFKLYKFTKRGQK